MEHSVTFSFEGRFFTSGNLATASQIWFAFHGYGQLASSFVKKFSGLAERNAYIIVPEALSRFYLEDTTSRMRTGNTRVGASWMTREDRLRDIDNYLRFLNTIYRSLNLPKDIPVTICGFSQGAATATRWAIDGEVDFQRLILWAGIFPPDVNFDKGRGILKDKETIVVFGDKDPFINDERFAEMKVISANLGITPSIVKFDGEHSIDEKTLLKFL